ncbi:hypothetical protein Ssi02_29240 [Sinosporangium siamense]|uniref:Uncharacterized protein n=1 Tax=Sinosporangium siamense TaxID=1367973 RepID=A0A919RFI3_9ACTN|nr:hypothetical protein Ssi02_29240 [Sinosporangium siamense]
MLEPVRGEEGLGRVQDGPPVAHGVGTLASLLTHRFPVPGAFPSPAPFRAACPLACPLVWTIGLSVRILREP